MPKHDTPEFRQLDKLLRTNGYVLKRISGDHFHYAKKGCHKLVTVPKDVNRMIMKRLIKQIGGR